VNFFLVNDSFVLVDLPGYGYARISKERRAEWKPLIEGYLRSSTELRGIVELLDVRHDPTAEDQQMLAFLASVGVPTLFALTKIDKLTVSQRKARIQALVQELGVAEDQVIPFSSVTGEGRDELAEAVMSLVGQPAWRAASTGRRP
jgi:GTP-binding protein